MSLDEATIIRTEFRPRSQRKPGRIVAVVVNGEHAGRREAFGRQALGAGDGHAKAAIRLARVLELGSSVEEIAYRNSGSTFRVCS